MGDIKPDLGLLKTLSIFREAIAESSSFEVRRCRLNLSNPS